MKKIFVILVMAVSLLTPDSWSQMGAPSKLLEVTIGQMPTVISTLVVTSENHYVVVSTNSNVEFDQKIFGYDSNGTLLWVKAMNTVPFSALSCGNNAVASNTGNGFLVTGHDTLFVYDANGNITTKIKTPGEGTNGEGNKMIFKDLDHYYVVTFTNLYGEQLVTIYSNDLSVQKSFPINTYQGGVQGFVSENNGEAFYISSYRSGGGDSSSVSCNLAKYSFSGDLLWNKHLPDRGATKICPSGNGVYCFSTLYFHTQTLMAWEIIKVDKSGGETWSKLWLGDYPGDTTDLCMSANTILEYKNGIIVFGNSTRLGQNPGSPEFDLNSRDAVAIAFDSVGDIKWKIRIIDSVNNASFGFARFDLEGYLLVGGDVDRQSKLWKYYVPGMTAVTTENNSAPSSFLLSQNYPNPFNPTTTINFSITKPGHVTLKVYDLLGHEVASLVNENLNCGAYKINFDAQDLSSGVYVYQLRAGDFIGSKKMMLLK